MEIGESSTAEEDRKQASVPQHCQSPTTSSISNPPPDPIIKTSKVSMSTTIAASGSPLMKRSGSSCGSQLALKRVKIEGDTASEAVASGISNTQSRVPSEESSGRTLDLIRSSAKDAGASNAQDGGIAKSTSGTVMDGDASAVSHSTGSNGSLSGNVEQSQESPEKLTDASVPLKSTHFRHLRHKYLSELEYMLREFQKLERQLLGAKTANGSGAQESAGSRERREKLHSFIQHLEDTVQQIITGCELEAAGKTTCPAHPDRDTALSNDLTREKEEEENVQKIEEHILANLLPVKVRLKKQLAAQQGAKHNPAGMPTVRGVAMQPADNQGKATFLKQVPERRPSQFGKPLAGGGSSLTQKLHGQTLGRQADTPASPEKQKVLYGGMAPGSSQVQSSVSAANTVHKLVIRNPTLLEARSELHLHASTETGGLTPTSTDTPDTLKMPWPAAETSMSTSSVLPALGDPEDFDDFGGSDEEDVKLSSAAHAAIVSYEERRKQRKRRRKQKKMLLKQQAAAAKAAVPKRKKVVKKRQGPRKVEYTCALCNEVYSSTCDHNPWWALAQQECAKCHKQQIPRVDITAPNNAIEYHPALLAHIEDNSANVAVHAPESVMLSPPAPKASVSETITTEDLESDLSDDDGLLSDGDSIFSTDTEDFSPMSAAEQAETERFGLEYDGPKMTDQESARLLTLLHHATTCPCHHKNKDHREVCRSAKWMLLHIRDCPGTTATFDICPFPWCRKTKHLLYHLVSCTDPKHCPICSTANLTTGMMQLQGLNHFRGKKYCQVLAKKTATTADASKARAPKPRPASVSRKAVQVVLPLPAPLPPATIGPSVTLGEAPASVTIKAQPAAPPPVPKVLEKKVDKPVDVYMGASSGVPDPTPGGQSLVLTGTIDAVEPLLDPTVVDSSTTDGDPASSEILGDLAHA